MALPSDVKIILGSSSSTRQAIMKEMGYAYDVVSADIDERAIRREKPEDLVMALAQAKAQAILTKLGASKANDFTRALNTTLLITADQVVVHESHILEKPTTAEEARQFIQGYSRSPAATVGAVLVTNLKTGFSKGGVDRCEIYFHPIPEDVIDTLVRLGNTITCRLRKIKEGSVFWAAGGLLVEHPLVSPLVDAMVGTIDSVMGLPKDLTVTLIREVLRTPSH